MQKKAAEKQKYSLSNKNLLFRRYRRTGSMQPRSTCSTAKKNIDYHNDMNVNPVSNNNYQKLCRNYTVDATLGRTSRPTKSYLIQRYTYFD